jgi:hypothetical protein
VGGGHGTISQYRVTTGGELKHAGTPVSAGSGADFLYSLAISPDGKSLYAPNDTAVYQFNIGPTGLLKAKSKPSVPASAGAQGIWLTASGKSAYTANWGGGSGGTVSEYNIGTAGLLAAKPVPTLSGVPYATALLIGPDQGPAAAFTTTPGPPDSATHFNGSASHDADGRVVRYAWSFGDGTSAVTPGPTTSHIYKKAGKYTVSLTVIDDSGCSTAFVFTGSTAYCSGGPAARRTQTLTVKS